MKFAHLQLLLGSSQLLVTFALLKGVSERLYSSVHQSVEVWRTEASGIGYL
jgi:hypothetical protein